MKPTLALLLIAVLTLSACKKEDDKDNTDNAPQTVNELVGRIVGIYNTTAYCYSGSGVAGYTYDTVPNTSITITALNDTMLQVDNHELTFIGNLTDKQYQFQDLDVAPSNGANILMDSTITHIQYCNHTGGIGGGAGCCYEGSK